MNKWMNGWMNEWIYEWMNEWMDKSMKIEWMTKIWASKHLRLKFLALHWVKGYFASVQQQETLTSSKNIIIF